MRRYKQVIYTVYIKEREREEFAAVLREEVKMTKVWFTFCTAMSFSSALIVSSVNCKTKCNFCSVLMLEKTKARPHKKWC